MTSALQPQETRLSESVLWALNEEYYKKSGISAWRTVPFHITSNSYIAETYVEQVVSFLLDYAGKLDFSQPLYFIEAGAGTGCFSHYFLREFSRKLHYYSKLQPLKWVYIITDIVPQNLAYWQDTGAFHPFIASGNVDFALFNPERDTDLQLVVAKRTLAAADVKNPLVMIANYFLDSLRVDRFRINAGVLEEALFQFDTSEVRSNPSLPVDFKACRKTVRYKPVTGDYYGHLIMDSILKEYMALFRDGSILFPVSTLKMLDNITRLAGNRLLLISGDKGFTHLSYMKGHWDIDFTIDGAISYSVNFDAIRRYFSLRGGNMWCMSDAAVPLKVNVGYLLEGFTDPLDQARYYFEEKINKQNIPNYLFDLLDHIPAESNGDLLLRSFRTLVQISNFDAFTFHKYARALFNWIEAHNLNPSQLAEWLEVLHRVRNHVYPAMGKDVAVWLGILYQSLDAYEDSREVLEYVVKGKGADYYTYYYLGVCYERHYRQPATALSFYEQALKLKPGCEFATEAIRRVKATPSVS